MMSKARLRDPALRSRLRNWLAPALIAPSLAVTALAATGLVAAIAPVAAHADTPGQAETVEARLRRIEGELRAVQRKVFPDGAGRTFAPEITPGPTTAVAQPGPAAGNAAALGDMLSRIDAVEAQVKALTATSEDNQNRLATLESRIGALESAQASAAAAASAAPVTPAPAAAQIDGPPPAKPGRGPNIGAAPPPDAAPPGPAAAGRAATVAAIDRPSSDDKGEDAYTYGYRLWEAKFFPEAEAVLLDFIQQYPAHKRISYARNLLGRAYLDDNKPGAAAQWFAQNYRADKAGDRAPDSLLYLAVAMTRLKEIKRACIALGEFHQTYPTESDGRLKGQYDAVTKTVNCN
jgi:TolA-binding protein